MASLVFSGLNQRFALLPGHKNSPIHNLRDVNLMNDSLKEMELRQGREEDSEEAAVITVGTESQSDE